MIQVIYEEELVRLEKTIKEFSEKCNIILVFNGQKYPKELAVAIKSTTVKLPK